MGQNIESDCVYGKNNTTWSKLKRQTAKEYAARMEDPRYESDTVQCKTRFSFMPLTANLHKNGQGFVVSPISNQADSRIKAHRL